VRRHGGQVGAPAESVSVAGSAGPAATAWVAPAVAATALARGAILIRAAFAVTAAAAGLRVVPNPDRLLAFIGAVVLVSVVEVSVVGRWPAVIRRRPAVVVLVDFLTLIGTLALVGPGIAFYAYAVGSTVLAGALLGLFAIPMWVAQAVLGYAAAATLIRATQPAPDIAVFVLVSPMAAVVSGMVAAFGRAALLRHVALTVGLVAAAQGSAAASERARLARELHDSVAKTLRGVSFAALALPASLRRRPDLAEQLARTVSSGAEAAAREARELVTALRLDRPDGSFVGTIDRLCRDWSAQTGIAIRLDIHPVEPAIDARYELSQILREALVNVARHARARQVDVALRPADGQVRLTVVDDGVGLPERPGGPATGSYGLVGMAERARAVGGRLWVRSEPGRGVRIDVVVPAGGETAPMTEWTATDRAVADRAVTGRAVTGRPATAGRRRD
jgi:signal transduction histidine kinase